MAIHDLPTFATPFIGRTDDIIELGQLLEKPDSCLLTLIGPGGIGKTRLAVEVALTQLGIFPGGVYFVPLQPLTSVDTLVTTIVEALPLQLTEGDDPHQRLLTYLSNKCLLLILDNFEHLLDGVDIVLDILSAAKGVKLLVTSRERLNLQAEQVWPVTGLNVPQNTEDLAEDHSAVALFVERARRVQPGFSLVAERESVTRICQLVAGLPLALELAAVWVRVMPCQKIADEIETGIDILTTSQRDLPHRHQSIRAVFDHSWQLLTDEEQRVFSKLAVFRSGFTLEAARQVAGASVQTLASLIDKSLIVLTQSGRYDLHELVRQYAAERLEMTGETENIRQVHSLYFADFIYHRAEDLKGRGQLAAMIEVGDDFENIRTAWRWAVDRQQTVIVAKMIDGIWVYSRNHYRTQEAIALFQYAQKRFIPDNTGKWQRLWGRLLARAATFADTVSQAELETALQIAQRYDDKLEIALCLRQLGWTAYYAHQDYDQNIKLLEQSLACYRQLHDHYHTAGVLYDLMAATGHAGTWENFQRYSDESLRIRRRIGDRIGIAWSIVAAALEEGRHGHFAEAESLWFERIAIGQAFGHPELVAMGHAHVSHKVYFLQGDFAQAQSSAEAAIHIGQRIDNASAVGWGQVTLGLLASMDERYVEGKILCQQGASMGGYELIADLAAWGQAIALCGLEDFEAASAFLVTAADFLNHMLGHAGMVGGLPVAAIVLASRDQPVRAVELLALAFTHPVSASGWMEQWPLLDRLRARMEQTLGSTEYAAAWKRGKTYDLEHVFRVLRKELTNPVNDPVILANQNLSDPLTPRELEVLALMGEGLTNAQIAERLFITIGTVKSYTNKVFSKLDVANRVQAVQRGQELHLL